MTQAAHKAPPAAAGRASGRTPDAGAAPVDSAAILGGQSELKIAHAGCVYTLRVTRAGKLILTK
ncbi:MAG: hemin uptake protein HemP [Rhodocyclaceae bacterium]|nr:hemin uptake protein HemP [Rhodocyclaceae bacterium]